MPPHQPDDASLPSLADDLDIVIPTIRSLSFLESWRPFFEPYHLIIIQDGDVDDDGDVDGGKGLVEVPPGFSYERHTRRDIERRLGKERAAKCISFKDSACRCYGFLVSKKRYIFTIDDDCFVAQTPSGAAINALRQHIRNLCTPSTPHYFNTLYDPFSPGADFVRGFPFSMRTGVPTAISHGLWLNVPDYDAPTQLAKPLERNLTHVDAVLTVPKGTLYPMCGMNLAFDRKLIGPAMWFGLMGAGQPLGRYDDMWAGWCSKVVCDHLNFGAKTGKPYVWHSKASDPLTNLRKEFKGILWQESMVEFFASVRLPEEATTASEAYAALAAEVKKSELVKLDPYFSRVAEGMETWLEVWRELNPPSPPSEFDHRSAATTTTTRGKVEGEGEKREAVVVGTWLSGEERASASARGPASAEAVRCAAAGVVGAAAAAFATTKSEIRSSSSSDAAVAAAASVAPSAANNNNDEDNNDENTAPFTPQNSAPPPPTSSSAAVKAVSEAFAQKAVV